jgi:uncharacterized protein (DUF885 family)
MDRRAFLASGAVASLASSLPTRLFAQGGDAELNALFDAIFADNVRQSPEMASSLGLDKGNNAAAKHKLNDRSPAEAARQAARTKDGWPS